MTAKDNILSQPVPHVAAAGTPVQARSHDPAHLFPPMPDCSELTLRCRRADYSASLVARAVEDCDAHLLNLNVTSAPGSDAGDVTVDIRINHRNALSVARSLSRYGFEVTSLSGLDPSLADTARERLDLLIHTLDI